MQNILKKNVSQPYIFICKDTFILYEKMCDIIWN